MKKWHLKEREDNNLAKDNPGINPVILHLLTNRGFSPKQIKNFLNPNYSEQLHDPFLFKDMQKVVDLINKHLAKGNKITVYGDYDADGVSSAAVMCKVLEFLGCKNLDVYIPHRETEGYGLNLNAVETISKNKTNLIITVDGGIRSIKEVERARELGMDIIVTDHHEPGDELPDCLIVNPKVKDDKYPFDGLAGVGVAFKVAQALLSVIARNEATKQSRENKNDEIAALRSDPLAMTMRKGEAFEKWLLDLVCLGTIADLMPLLDENRVFAKYGLVVLNKTKRVGLKKLIEVARSGVHKNGNTRELDAWQVGFQLAPRLNAAGRLGHASNAYQLLVTEGEKEADRIAQELDNTNKERQNLTEEIFNIADKDIKAEDKIIFAVWPGLASPRPQGERVGGEGVWPAGIMGLVAGKLSEKYYRPSLAITQKENGDCKIETVGSARSIAEFNIVDMLENCAEFLKNYGGHKQAAGFTVKEGMVEKFLAKAKDIAEAELKNVELAPSIEIDMEINFSDIDENLYEALNKLKPYGVKNPQPKFMSKGAEVINASNMGIDGQHLKLRLKQAGTFFEAIAFSHPEEWNNIKIGDAVDLVYYIDMNEWNGNKNLQLKIIDLKPHNS